MDDEVEPLVDDDSFAPLTPPVGGGPGGRPAGGPWPPPLALELEFDNIARKAATAADRFVDVPASPEEVEVVVEEASDVEVAPAASAPSVVVPEVV